MHARRHKTAAGVALFALAVWTAGWSVHAVHALRAALWPNLAEICSVADPHGAQPGQSSQCPVCSQFLAAAAPQQALPLLALAYPSPALTVDVPELRVAAQNASYILPAPRAPPVAA
jgi:hypothetical protein